MPPTRLDGVGTELMKTLEETVTTLQTIHGLVERLAMEVNAQRPAAMLPHQIKRIAVPLQGQLSGKFGPLADLVSAMILAAGRGGSESIRMRTLREQVALLRTAVEMQMNRVREQHSVAIELTGG